MSKRKLTRKQQGRIQQIQRKYAKKVEQKSTHHGGEADEHRGDEQPGLVIAHYGTQVTVQALTADNSPGQQEQKRCHIRTNLGSLVTGDRVIWRDEGDTGVVVTVLPRTSTLSRPDPYGDIKVIAANIDNILLVVAPLPKPYNHLIDRYLVTAETMSIKPIIVLNKTDLIDDDNRDALDTLKQLYRSLDYEMIETSTLHDQGIDTLIACVKDKTSIFIGQSGTGKSSLINRLLPGRDLRTGSLSNATQQGTHTTTTARWFDFPPGGSLIDSPGIQEMGLWHMRHEDILHGFTELRPYVGLCRFRNCQHQQEPDCAIQHAYQQGHIAESRMKSYLFLREDKHTL